jgi:hypothetical protein
MNTRKLIVPVLVAGLIFSAVLAPGLAAQKDKQEAKPQASQRVFIPKEIKAILEEGLTSRQGRQDIPFNIFRTTFLPAQTAFYEVFFLKIKNGDLGYAPAMPSQIPAVDAAAVAPATGKLKATFNVFLQFRKLENGVPTQIVKEVYIPASIEADSEGYDPNKEEFYSIGYALFPGNYLLAIAMTSLDQKKVGTQYFEFTLPDAKNLTKELDITPIFLSKDQKDLTTPETVASLHKGYFMYSVRQITPNLDNTIGVGEFLDVFYYVIGAQAIEPKQPTERPTWNIEVQYEVKKGQEPAIRFQPANYDNPLVSHPLPMKQTLIIKTGDQERTESKDLGAGNYTLNLKITDKISGNTCTKTFDFTVK